MPVPQSITDARNALAASRADTARALFARTTAQADLDAALRGGDPNAIAAAQSAFNAASAALSAPVVGARSVEQAARDALNAQITQWLQDANHQPLTPDADFARMDRTDCPVAFFPLRLETRFDVTAKVLHIRVYPDEFFSDIHERELTPEEQAAGDDYWTAVGNTADGKETADLWAPVAKRFGVPRASYIIAARDPSTEPGTPTPRATVPSRGAEAVLPDRWVALAYKNGQLRHTQAGLPIPEPIDLTANPSADDQTMSEVADGFTVPSTILWTMRYDVALAKGMAIDITNLATDELQSGFDRVIVLGVKTSLDPVAGTDGIVQLFYAHHYTRGMDLVPLGTPTNNIPGQPTPFTMKDPSAEESFQIERLGPQGEDFGFDLDYEVLSNAFGFGPFTNLRGAVEFQQDLNVGRSMRQVAWSATFGYFMRQMMNPLPYLNGVKNATPIFDEGTIGRAKDFFTTYVSAQGPLPAFRVGAVPYGVLPAISLSRMVPRQGEDRGAIDVMRKLLPMWQAAVPRVPVVSASSTDRNTDLMRVLSQKSGSDGVYIRNSLGPNTITNLWQLILQDVAAALTSLAQVPATTVAPLGHPEWAAARIFGLTFLNAVSLYAGPLVTANPKQGMLVSAVATPTLPTDSLNYLAFLQDTRLTFDLVHGQGSMPNAAAPNELLPLLYLLARHSMLLQYVEIGRSLLAAKFSILPFIDVELWSIGANVDPLDVFTLLGSTPTGDKLTLFQQIQRNVDGQGNSLSTAFPLGPLDDALANLSGRPVKELERVLTETLDLAAHRLDAFITGLASRRLKTFRDVEADSEHPVTTYFGGYGVVENVRPVTRPTRQIAGLGTVSVQSDNGGYIHAPSLRHATTAAILRSGRMAEKSDPTKYAIELPSDRARRARLLIDGVRDGQSLGELLGFELESGLRARAVTGTEGFIEALRNLYPLVANKSGLDPGLPADGIAAANVVDGQKVRQAATPPSQLPFGTGGLPPKPSPGQAAIAAEIQKLSDIVDAIGDLEMSETVFQIAAGDVASAEAAMNFLPTGSNPPQSEVTTSPTTGIAVSQRVALLLEGAAPQAPNWTLGVSLRGQFDPFVEAWVGSLLGDPSGASATVSFQQGGNAATGHVSVADLKTVGPLDFLALAQGTSVPGQGSPLDRQLAAAFLAKPANAGATQVVVTAYDTPTSGPSIPQLIELGRALGAVLGGARELAAADLVLTPDEVDQSTLGTIAGQLSQKATAAVGALAGVVVGLSGADPRPALIAASAYQAEAFPDPGAAAADLAVPVMNAKGELSRRVTDAQSAAPAADAASSDIIAAAINQIRILFGRNTLAVLPSAVPPSGGELGQSLAALDRPLNINDQTTFDSHQAPGRYLQQASRLHDRLGAWRRFGLYAGALGAPAPRVSVAQLPFVAGEDWAGRTAPTGSRTSLLLISANGQSALPDPTQPWRGLLLDQWTEVVPSTIAETGLAFHYDSSDSEAPQVILMGMHSGQSGGWTLTELQAIVSETIDLALIRPVDNDLVALGQLVPAICLAANSRNLVVSTDIGPNARENVPIVVT
jgi:hypothetical protein